jgi:hypothetical protein
MEQLLIAARRDVVQSLTLKLEGITAGDYLTWVRDPEPPALGRDLRYITVHADPVGAQIDLELGWDREPPSGRAALHAAGFPVTPEVVNLASTMPRPARQRRRHRPRSQPPRGRCYGGNGIADGERE